MGELTGSLTSRVAFEEAEHLVTRLKEGDEEAFAEVFHLYRDLVYTLACKLLADKSEALDITQEVFLTLFRRIGTFRGESSLKTWLYRVTLNQAANRNRWWKRRFRHRTVPLTLNLGSGDHDGVPVDPPSGEADQDRRVLSRELEGVIQRSLERLPFEQRAAIILRDVHSLSYEEIAEVTGVHVGTVKSRIARGRERLRQMIGPHLGGKNHDL